MNYIHRLADSQAEEAFTNSGPDRAAIVFNELFSNSSKEFRLYAGNLGGKISAKILYLSGLRQFLQKKHTILKILVEDTTKLTQNTELFTILKEYKSKIQIRESLVKAMSKDGKEMHFAVGDENMYRIEVDPKNFKAVGSFNDLSESKELSALFKRIFISDEYSSDKNFILA